ncbi:unnamed protein product, partial [Mesorhabditis spiculigera]
MPSTASLYCEVATELLDIRSPYLMATLLRGILCTIAIPLIVHLFWSRVLQLYAEIHLLLVAKISFILSYAIFGAISHFLQVSQYFLHTDDPCARLFHVSTCNWLRAIQYANTFSLSTSMFCLVIDGGLAILRPVFYQTYQHLITAVMLLGIVSYFNNQIYH